MQNEKMSRGVRELYLGLLGKDYGKRLSKIVDMPQHWVGLLFKDGSVRATPPLMDENGLPAYPNLNEEP